MRKLKLSVLTFWGSTFWVKKKFFLSFYYLSWVVAPLMCFIMHIFFFFCHTAHNVGILIPSPVVKPGPLRWKLGVLTAGPPGKSWLLLCIFIWSICITFGWDCVCEKLICWSPSPQYLSSVTQLCPTLRPHELQHVRPPCPSPTPGVRPNTCP